MTTQRFKPDYCRKCGGRMRCVSVVTATLVHSVPYLRGNPYAPALYREEDPPLLVSKCERCGWSVTSSE